MNDFFEKIGKQQGKTNRGTRGKKSQKSHKRKLPTWFKKSLRFLPKIHSPIVEIFPRNAKGYILNTSHPEVVAVILKQPTQNISKKLMEKSGPIGHSIRHITLGKPIRPGLGCTHFLERQKSHCIRYHGQI